MRMCMTWKSLVQEALKSNLNNRDSASSSCLKNWKESCRVYQNEIKAQMMRRAQLMNGEFVINNFHPKHRLCGKSEILASSLLVIAVSICRGKQWTHFSSRRRAIEKRHCFLTSPSPTTVAGDMFTFLPFFFSSHAFYIREWNFRLSSPSPLFYCCCIMRESLF